MTTQTAAEIQSKVDDHLRRVLDELEAGEAWAMLRYGDDRSQYEAPWVQVWSEQEIDEVDEQPVLPAGVPVTIRAALKHPDADPHDQDPETIEASATITLDGRR